MNKLAAVLLAFLAVVLLIVIGWGLVYLPGTMSASAQHAIEDFQRVLARDAPRLSLTHGAISANPLTASVTVADVSLRHADGNALKAAALGFTVDPFSGEISALEAQALSFDKENAQAKVERATVTGLTSETRWLLGAAARGELTMEAVLQKLDLADLRLRTLTVTTPNEGELSLQTVAMENMDGGIIGRFYMDGLSLYVRTGRNPGELTLRRLEFAGLNIGEIAAAARRPGMLPVFTAPLIKSLNFEDFRIRAKDTDFAIRGGELDAIYGSNHNGRAYARKMTFVMNGIIVKPRGRNPAFATFLAGSGLNALEAQFNMVSTGDHAKRSMALEEMSLRMAGLADIDFRFRIGNLPKEAFEPSVKPEELARLMTEFSDATLIDGSLVLSNTRLVQLSLAQAARSQGIDAKAMIAAMLDQMRMSAQRTGNGFLATLADELETFLNDPKVLKISVDPKPPLPFHRWQQLSRAQRPGPLVRALNLKVEANR